MDTPGAMRGMFYTTHLTLRCPNYCQCKRCLMCSSYNIHNPLCLVCEKQKPASRHHECTVSQVENIILMEELMGQPRFNINADAKDVTVDLATTSFNNENAIMVDRMIAAERER